MKGDNEFAVSDIECTGAEGSATTPGTFGKPMDKPPKKYTADESVPRDKFGEIPCPDPYARTMEKAKRFSTG